MDGVGTVSFRDAVRVWLRVARQSFGGPAGQIAVMHRILVEEKRWIGEERFLHALSYCMLLPGPEAQQLATYIGWLMHRTRGGLVAGTLFVLPGFVTILVLSLVYAAWGTCRSSRGSSSASSPPCWRSCSRRCCASGGARSASRAVGDRGGGYSPPSSSCRAVPRDQGRGGASG